MTELDLQRLEAALIAWKHPDHRIDSNGYCDDCMRFVDLVASENAAEIAREYNRLRNVGASHD